MSNITNYYTELQLDKDLPLAVLQAKLKEKDARFKEDVKLRSLNIKAVKWVKEALEIFATEESRAQYDQQLLTKKVEEVEEVDDDFVNFKEWYDKAFDYYANRQYDLAVTAIKKVFEYRKNKLETDSLLLAGYIYNDAHHYNESLNYLNEALILDPDNAAIYRGKYIALYNIIHTGEESMNKITRHSEKNELPTLLREYLSRVESTGDEAEILYAKEFVAGEYFWNLSGFVGYSDGERTYYPQDLADSENAKKGVELASEISPKTAVLDNIIDANTIVHNYLQAKKQFESAEMSSLGDLLFNVYAFVFYIFLWIAMGGTGLLLVCLIVGGGFLYINNKNSEYERLKTNKEELGQELLKCYHNWRDMKNF